MNHQLGQVGSFACEQLGIPTVKNTLKSNYFCQENLTKPLFLVENIDTYSIFSIMGKLGNLGNGMKVLAAATMLGGAAEAQETPTPVVPAAEAVSAQVTDCVAFVKEQRELASDVGIAMSRSEQKSLLHECNNGQLETRIAEQRAILAALDEQIQQLDLRLDEQARIIDAQGQELARIVAINGRLVIQRAAVQAEGQQYLDEAERILNELIG